jgi:phospholipid N-methyltransferase
LAYRLFIREFFRTFRVTASLVPSSRFLAAAMLDPVDFRKPCTIVELGPGTGVMTKEILRRMTPDSRLFAFEVNPQFIRHLRAQHRDPRLTVLHADACELADHLRDHNAGALDAVISSLGLTNMPHSIRTRIVQQAESCLAPGGVLTQFQYLTSRRPIPDLPALRIKPFREKQFLHAYFPTITTRRVLMNFPPAVVFACYK